MFEVQSEVAGSWDRQYELQEWKLSRGGVYVGRSSVAVEGLPHEVRPPTSGLAAAEELLRVAGEREVDLIVIGLRRRSPVGKLILGSNAQRVLLDAPCPVLAVKAGE